MGGLGPSLVPTAPWAPLPLLLDPCIHSIKYIFIEHLLCAGPCVLKRDSSEQETRVLALLGVPGWEGVEERKMTECRQVLSQGRVKAMRKNKTA